MKKGAFQISRSIFENEIWDDVIKFRIFFYILGNAVYSHEGLNIAGIKLERGQFLRSLRSLRDDLAYKEGRGNAIKKYTLTTIQRKIKSLVNEGRIEVKSTEYGTVFTVVNYATYQSLGSYKNNSMEQQRNSNGTATEQQRNNTNKDKKDKKDNNKRRKRVYDESSIHFILAKRLYDRILENNPNHREPNLQNWANDVRLMMERDKRTEKQIAYVIDWCQSNSFWKSNILSISKLRERFDQLVIQIKSNHEKVVEIPSYEVKEDAKHDERNSDESGHVRLFR